YELVDGDVETGFLPELPGGGRAWCLARVEHSAGQRPAVAVGALDHEQSPGAGIVQADRRDVGSDSLAPVPQFAAPHWQVGRDRVDWQPVDDLEGHERSGLAGRPVDREGVGQVGPVGVGGVVRADSVVHADRLSYGWAWSVGRAARGWTPSGPSVARGGLPRSPASRP